MHQQVDLDDSLKRVENMNLHFLVKNIHIQVIYQERSAKEEIEKLRRYPRHLIC